jgi:Undecaprenyl-phosphate glucose phosphotransferase
MIRERNQSFKIAFIAIDFLIAAASFALAVALNFFVLNPEKRVDTAGIPLLWADAANGIEVIIETYFYLGMLISLLQIAVFVGIDLYHPRRGLHFAREFEAIVRGVFINLAFVLALLFFYRGTTFSRLVFGMTAIISIGSFSIGHFLFRRYMGFLRARGKNIKNVLILGTGNTARRFMNTLNRHAIYGYRVIGLLGPVPKGAASHIRKMILGGVEDLKKITRHRRPEMVVYAMHGTPKSIQSVMDFCDSEGIDCRIIPDIVDIITHRARIEDMDGIPILTIRPIPLQNGYNRFLKRVFDLIFSATVMVLLSPLFLLITLLIKISSPGPILFTQKRVGLDHRIFNVYKFRSMHVQERSASDSIWGTRRDERITRVGKFLRKTSLDEIPQFLNVFKGDMSVVGPRPERPHFVEQFKTQYVHYMRRHSAKAGITGWAQIQGLRGDTSIQKRVEADIFYIENWSFWFDIYIILKTIPAQFRNPGE